MDLQCWIQTKGRHCLFFFYVLHMSSVEIFLMNCTKHSCKSTAILFGLLLRHGFCMCAGWGNHEGRGKGNGRSLMLTAVVFSSSVCQSLTQRKNGWWPTKCCGGLSVRSPCSRDFFHRAFSFSTSFDQVLLYEDKLVCCSVSTVSNSTISFSFSKLHIKPHVVKLKVSVL